MPSPKELDKALALSADRARRMAQAFGLKVPGIAEKPAKASGRVDALRLTTLGLPIFELLTHTATGNGEKELFYCKAGR
jgi:hypothetical protein